MKYLFGILVLAGFFWTCSSASAEDAIPDGQMVYKTNCVSCHGVYGKMGVSGAFDLSASPLSLEERVKVITDGRNAMASFKSVLSPEKIRAAAEYTLQLKKN